MDKGWMSKDIFSHEYMVGVESFLRFAIQNASDPDLISCPCAKCGNLINRNVKTIKAHLGRFGMDLTYDKWIFHGEEHRSTYTMNDHDDLMQHDQNKDVDDTVDMVHDAFDDFDDNHAEMSKLLVDAERPLYSGCSKFTKLAATLKLYNLKAKYGWSDTSFNDLLTLLREMLPSDNELPSSLYLAKKSLCTLGMTYEKIHACPNDCILYRKDYNDLNDCPTCGSSRWKLGKNGKLHVNVPAKVLWYFPPIPRFQRMFRSKALSKELTWHANKRKCDGHLRHPADAPAWKLVDHKWEDFSSEPRNLRLAISADGINPHSLMNSSYSCWPVVLITYNLPPWLCMKRKFMMLTLLVSGPKQPGNDIDVYLEPLVDDLKKLWESGIQVYDAYREENFMLRAVLLWTINDFPAYGNMSGCSVKGYHACPVCGENTFAKRLANGKKMSYTGHRKFLHQHHPYRRQKKAFDGQQEFNSAPKPLSGQEVFERVESIDCVFGKMMGKPGAKRKATKSYWKKKSIFFELEYWKHLHVRHVLDVMHIEKNICESLLGTLLDIPGKTKDGLASRLDLVDMGIRTELAPINIGEKKILLPAACYTLSKAEKREVCKSLFEMKVPVGYSSNISKLVSMKELKLVGLKSHDNHTLMQQLLPVAIRGVLPKHVRYSITRLCFFFNVICQKVIDVTKLDEIQREVVITLCLLEKYFPPSFFDIMVHLTVHLVREVKLCGPIWYRWMYPFERFMKTLKGYVRNRNRPEGCIAECYIAEEAMEFCSDYLSNVHTIGIPSKNLDMDRTRPLSQARVEIVIDVELEQAHRYVLNNDDEIDAYIIEHKTHLKKTLGHKLKTQKMLQDEHNRSFIMWLQERVSIALTSSTHQISEKLKWMAQGPVKEVIKYDGYLIDGVTFHTKERDDIRTVQNSGVSIVASTMHVSSAKDKNAVVADMKYYGRIDEIWALDYQYFQEILFKCTWVDNHSGVKVDSLGFTLVNLNKVGYESDPFIFGSQASQVFYVEDPEDHTLSVVLSSPSKDYSEYNISDELEYVATHHPCFSKGLPTVDVNDIIDDVEHPCIRDDCEGIWVETN